MQKIETREHRGQKTVFCLFESSTDMAQTFKREGWERHSYRGACEKTSKAAIEGDDKAAAESDKFLSRFDQLNLVSTGFAVTDEVVGAVPNVPAFLSGAPVNMRLRKRTVREQAPLAIVVDLTTSGAISGTDMARRGSAILAAARILSATRPVELWCFAGLGTDAGGAVFVGHRLETSPMDLARAAPCFADPLWARGIGYGSCHAHGSNGGWPYNDRQSLSAQETEQVMRLALPHLADVLAIPGITSTSPLVGKPEQWLAEIIAQYAPQAHAA